ncbi:MAG TPA: LapA family protein [Chloroflexota bacterium]|nr:LapA family protein [Chloroflexota bacterium]
MSQVVVFLALAFSILIAVFAIQNSTSVPITFLSFSWLVPASVLILLSAAFGAAVMLLLGISREVGLRWRHRAVAQQLKAAQTRVAQLEAAQPAPSTALSSTQPVTQGDGGPTPS